MTSDIVIYGSSPAAISAAVQAKRMGKTAVVVSPEKRIGGLTTGGLGQTDIGNKKAFGGIALEFYKDVAKWYADPAHWTRQTSEQYKPEGQTAGTKGKDSMWTFEPSAALAILEGWEKRDGLDIRRNEWLDRAKGVEKKDGRIVSIKTLSGNVYRGKVFIDATYEGDLMAAAGVSYTVGREANSVYGETISGIEIREAKEHQLQWYVSPYVVEGDPNSGLLPGIEPYNPNEKDGDGDKRVQAYNFRMCLTDDPENRIPFKKPANYDEKEYELLFRNFAKGEKSIPWNNSKMPNRKTDTNNNRGFSTDFIGRNYEWPEATYERRAEIFKAHLDYQQGLMWTLANHPRVPEHIRAEVSKWGTCKDEFLDGSGDGWQSQLYVREARRMVGDYVMTEHECRGDRTALHPVAMGAYTMDSHNVRRVVTAKGNAKNEGDVQDARRYSAWGPDADKRARGGWMQPYGIDYGAITPKRAECENLLVPVCLSASHMAFGSIRMEPVFFALGQAAGTAASLAVAGGTRSCASAVQEVPYGKLATRLKADGQVLPAMAIAINPSASVGRVETKSGHETCDTGLFGDFWWANRFYNHNCQIKKLDGKTVDLVMVGDAITHSWESHKDSWAKFTKGLTVFNLGYRGDGTHNLIWRIEHGELDGYKAKCIVLMIGTNNNWHECADPVEVAEAIKKIVGMIRERQPEAKIVMHPIFPRGNAPGSPKDVSSSARNKKTNELIAQFAKEDGKIVWIDFNDKLVDETGWVPKSIMPDGLNPSDAGYEIWMKALAPITDELRASAKASY